MKSLKIILLVVALVALERGVSRAEIIKSYDFDSGYSDTLGNGLDLVASGGSLGGGRYTFANNQGLRLDSALASTTDYGIEMKLKVTDSLSGYNKLIDFQNLASDLGLYFLSGNITFYTLGNTTGNISLNTDFTLGLARAGTTASVYLDGSVVATLSDIPNQAVPGGNILNFFEDDFATGQSEAFAGSVDFIRIHRDASTFGTAPVVPEPTSLALWSLGLVGMTFARRRRA